MRIPLSSPDIAEAEIDAVVAVLRTPRLSLGPVSEQFEAAVADYIGVPHAIAVSSGTAGLHLCIRALDIGEGDEVIVPSFAFIAAANAIRYERATPVFVDIDAATLNIDPRKIEAAITPRTRAIMAVHTFGVPADMRAILHIAERHRLVVIEDACEALGAEHRVAKGEARKAGSTGAAGVFAFYPNKQITTGEGGVVVTSDPALAQRIRALRNQGRHAGDDWFQHTELGYNYRLSEINCALGLAQMGRLEEILHKRAAVASGYQQRLNKYPQLLLPPLTVAAGRVSWFVYVLRLANRDAVMHGLAAAGIASGRYFAPIHLQPSYSAWRRAHLPVTESEALRTLALPFFNNIGPEAMDEVCATLCRLVLPGEAL